MYSAYIDDSGTDPKQLVAVASALIIPTRKVIPLEREWATFLQKESITNFHTSECVACNPKSEFAGWNEDRVKRVIARVRQIIRKYAVKAYSVSVDKAVYDAVIPNDLRRAIGASHYTQGVDGLGGFVRDWGLERSVPMEYVYDNTDKKQKKEIDRVMEHGEALYPSLYDGRYQFRKRQDVPALQLSDLFAWTCYQRSISYLHGKPISLIAEESWQEFSTWKKGEEDWAGSWYADKPRLQDWVRRVYADKKEMARINSLT